ncbi:hypothetical protein [Nonomuraea sp. NPDC049400]|uniref:hypothetical protein n=1 Tax=Nonomuraea sp. NPDC049400 TaxID=3364352 RepID=UPI0037953C64
MATDLKITGAEQLRRLAIRFKDAGPRGKQLQKELRKGIRTGAKPALAATRTAIRTIPVVGVKKSGGHAAREEHHFGRSRAKDEEKRRARAQRGAGLRQTIAGAVQLKVAIGSRAPRVRIFVDEKRLPEDQRTLPRHLDSKTGWRHPTFGKNPWVKQYGKPWFETTIRKHLKEVQTSILKAMDDIADKIEG